MVGRILTFSLYGLGVVLYYLGTGPLIRWIGRNNPKVVLYHECTDTESDYLAQLYCNTPPALLKKHLEYLSAHYNVVELETIVTGNAPPISVAVTFDDGYRSVYTNAFPLLRQAGVPATVYLISSVIDNNRLVWVNEMNCRLRSNFALACMRIGEQFAFPSKIGIPQIIDFCRLNFDPDKVDQCLEAIRNDLGIDETTHAREARLYLSWENIEEMVAANMSFGNHTATHPNLERLPTETQRREIEAAQLSLGEHLQIRSMAYPFGHHGLDTSRIAASLGLTSVVEVGGHNNPVRSLQIGRVHVSTESIAGLFSRMEVVEPVKGLLSKLLRHKTVRVGRQL